MLFVDKPALRAAMERADQTCRSLACITEALEQMSPDRYRASSRGLVGMLRVDGRTPSCHPKRAAAIEKALSAPHGSLFLARSVQRPVDEGQAA